MERWEVGKLASGEFVTIKVNKNTIKMKTLKLPEKGGRHRGHMQIRQ